MRSAWKGVIAGLVLLALLGALAARAGWIVAAVPRPHGPDAWLLARATGLVAYVALGFAVIAGLLVSTRAADRVLPRGLLVDAHGWLSPIALALVLAHAGVLLADDYVRFDLLDVLVPFVAHRERGPIAAGILGGYLVLVVHLSVGLRAWLGARLWRRLHALSFVAFVLVTIHALAAGSDRGSPWFAAIYLVVLLVVAALVALRLRGVRAAR